MQRELRIRAPDGQVSHAELLELIKHGFTWKVDKKSTWM